MRDSSTWTTSRLKNSVDSIQSGLWGDEPNGSSDDVRVARVADFDRRHLRVSEEIPTLRSVPQKDRSTRILESGDLLLEKSGGGDKSPVGFVTLYASELEVPTVPSNFLARVRVKDGMDSRYWLYVHSSLYDQRVTARSVKQTTGIQNLDLNSYLNEKVSFPRSEEQTRIADFLDRETARIDTLIEKQEKLIETLRERRIAEITEATTNPSGQVPLGRFMTKIRQGSSPSCDSDAANGIDEWGVLKTGCMNFGEFRPEENKRIPKGESVPSINAIEPGELIVSRGSSKELVGSAAVAPEGFPQLLLSDLTYGVKFGPDVKADFISYVLRSSGVRGLIEAMAKGSSPSMQKISQRDLKELPVWVPDFAEQVRIVEMLDRKEEASRRVITKAQEFIKLAKERRSALITAAVTGQIDVTEDLGG